ncbi:hypothetical protein COU78_01085 [Candidatus Peregrinibacteria bacterium CG10_big_fil_rev_8_21_14_0_10_49_24]|nr:MAG: hypothetical protein COV83_01335 [Candidatus Peregrinibacteria bacterium CG11_big_fil_rev_8_21_14_0_20_49_14]PIR51541.1 MAG: hypothetical protein COU78_01085 [Candidatus Peregrinibacteria bacterium CG10_big_fil_rev_8_21_14_0_10_49_24]PJA67815.1 MAG: hypothetical protein CO157_02255 [Candidatus Peregrinibacteria bacterium CG_4_9_14_3_um_filter_49_12]
MKKKRSLQLLKLVGIIIFFAIVRKLDTTALVATLKQVNWMPMLLAVLCVLCIYVVKAYRWHTLVRATGLHPTFGESWRLYTIGIFLGNITPGKLGELGRAAYLHKKGLPMKIGVLLSVADRAADGIVILLLGAVGVGILGGVEWTLLTYAALSLVAVIAMLILLQKRVWRISLPIIKLFLTYIRPHLIRRVILTTLLGWMFYFLWAVLLARSLGITVEVPVLVAAFTLTGLISMLPIAPSGLGTRDAALIFLLAPYGVEPEQAVAQALLMFTTILLMSIPGGWYWLREKH